MDSNETTITNYKVRAFTNSSDPDFIKALKIYSKHIYATDLTETNQVIFCLDNYNKNYKESDFVVCGFYQDRELIGYCQFIYISDEKLIIIDYIVIDEAFRGINVFYSFLEKVRELVVYRNYEVKYIVGEVNTHSYQNDEVPGKAKLLIKLLKSSNFGEVKSLYIQPMLGVYNYESEQRSILMLYPANQYEAIKKETFLKIVETIYFKHYERWYRFFLKEDELIKYQGHLHEVFKKVSDKITVGKPILIEKDDYLYSEQEFTKSYKSNREPKKIVLIFGFIGLLMLLICSTLILKHIFKLDFKNQFYILLATGALYLVILSLYSKKAANLFYKLLEKLIERLT